MSIILVNPNLVWKGARDRRLSYIDLIIKQNRPDTLAFWPLEHLGLASIQATCEAKGIPVKLVNGTVLGHLSVDETFAAIEATAREHGDPELVGFSGTNLVFAPNRALAERCHQRWPNVKTILGYDFASLNYERILKECAAIDYACQGDGELVFATLAERILNRRSPDDIPGLAYRGEGGKAVANPPKAVRLDDLPRAKRDDLPKVLKLGFGAAVFASRGCPYRCNYCTTGETSELFGSEGYRQRSVESIVDEIEYLKRDFGVTHVNIVDDLFLTKAPSSRERARRMADLLIERQLDVKWMIDARVDSLDAELFAHLKKAGLHHVFVGVEAASEETLVQYNKKYLLKQETPVNRILAVTALGIRVIPGMLMFHPKVTARELRANIEMLDAIGHDGHQSLMNRVKPYPGTPLYRSYEAEGLLTSGEWPVKVWNFVDERPKRMSDALALASVRPGSSFDAVRKEFLRHLEAWEKEEALAPGTVKLNPAVSRAVFQEGGCV